MCPEEFAAFLTSLAITIAKDRTKEDIDSIAVIFSQLSCTLATISVQRQHLQDKLEKEKNNQTEEEESVDTSIAPDTSVLL